MYRSENQYKKAPEAPLAIIPFAEISSITSRSFSAKKLFKKNQNTIHFNGESENVHVMYVFFKMSYE